MPNPQFSHPPLILFGSSETPTPLFTMFTNPKKSFFSSGFVFLLLYSGAGSRLLLIAGVNTYQMDAGPLTKSIFISFLSIFPLISFSTVLTLALCGVLKLKH